jgi:rhodanese-related sulfurtransferase
VSSETAVLPAEAAEELAQYTVIDVRTPGEYAAGHLPGAHNVPLDALPTALPALKAAAARGRLLLVCASGNRSATGCARLAAADVPAATLTGGMTAWREQGRPVERDAGGRAVWSMERQVRLAAGSLVVAGLALGTRFPRARWLSAAIGGGLVFSAVSDTCGMAAVLGKLPYNRARTDDLAVTLETLAH